MICCWSAKGGAGTSVVAAALALVLARRHGGALLVDLVGDQPAVLGEREPAGAGVAEWLASPDPVPPDALARLEVGVGDTLRLLPAGGGPRPGGGRAELLAAVLAQEQRPVVVDAGVLPAPVAASSSAHHASGVLPLDAAVPGGAGAPDHLAATGAGPAHAAQRDRVGAVRVDGAEVAGGGDGAGRGGATTTTPERRRGADEGCAELLATTATQSLLVTRACYLALRRGAQAPLRPSGVVLVSEEWRALRPVDVADVIGAPVVSEVPATSDIARAVDAGLLASRLPRQLERAVGRIA